MLGDAARLARGDRGLADGIQQAGLAVINVTHNHHHGGPGLQLVGGIHMVVDDLLLDGDGDFLLHLAAHFRCHIFGGIIVDGLVDTGHDAVLHQQLDDLPGGFLHPGSQLAHGDFVGNLDGDRRFPRHLHLQTAHFLLFLIAGLVSLEAALLLLLLLLALAAADALLAALIILNPLGYQIIHIGKPIGVDLHGGGIHHPAFPLPLRLLGLFRLGGGLLVLRTGVGRRLGLCSIGALGSGPLLCLGFGVLLGRGGLGRFCLGLRLGRRLHREHLLQ